MLSKKLIRHRSVFLLSLLVTLILNLLLNVSCTGLRIDRMHRYFKTSLVHNFKEQHIKKIGVYVFSNGASKDGTQPVWYDKVFTYLSLGIVNLSNVDSFDQRFFPPEIKYSSHFHPSDNLQGASNALAKDISSYLSTDGYAAQNLTKDISIKRPSVSDCLSDAQNKGFDAVFIVYYTGMYRWVKFESDNSYSTINATVDVKSWDEFDGFLYLPNAALFDVKTRKRLWSYAYYGLVQQAHIFNFLAPYNSTCEIAIVNKGGSDYNSSAPLAAKMIFQPQYWPGSYTPLPPDTN